MKDTTKRIRIVLILLPAIIAVGSAESSISVGYMPDDVDKLIQDLKNGDDWHRMMAAAELGSVKDTRAIVPLEEALKDNSSYVRAQAALSLGVLINYTKTRAIVLLIEALKDNSSYVRANAAWSLGAIKDDLAINPFMIVVEDNDSDAAYGTQPQSQCLADGTYCTLDSQCCSGWCPDYYCMNKNETPTKR